jgi:putative DNA primase/helicase
MEESMNWRTFLDDVFLGDREIINFAQDVVGYASTGDMTAGIIVVCKGHGRNGRTTFFKALALALQDQVSFCSAEMLLHVHCHNRPAPHLLRLKGARLTVFEVADFITSKELPMLKELSTDAEIVARDLWAMAPEKFRNSATPFLVCGDLSLKAKGEHAFISRLVFLPFPVRFMPGQEAANTWKKAQRSDFVLEALAKDADSIRRWIEEGARRYRANGLSIPERFRATGQTARRVA